MRSMAGNLRRYSWLTLIAAAVTAAGTFLACAKPLRAAPNLITIRDTGEFVIDDAHVVDPATKQTLESLLGKLQEKTTDQVKVLTVKTTGDEDVFDFAQRHYQLWKLGTKAKSNGALIVVAVQDHKVRIHTGYGLEGALARLLVRLAVAEGCCRLFSPGEFLRGSEIPHSRNDQ